MLFSNTFVRSERTKCPISLPTFVATYWAIAHWSGQKWPNVVNKCPQVLELSGQWPD